MAENHVAPETGQLSRAWIGRKQGLLQRRQGSTNCLVQRFPIVPFPIREDEEARLFPIADPQFHFHLEEIHFHIILYQH